MANRKRLIAGIQRKTVTASPSTHYPNGETEPKVKSDTGVLNAQQPEELEDPGEQEGGSTHTKIEASKKAKPKVKAAADDDLPNDSVNLSTIPNDVDPTQGYDINAESDDDIDLEFAEDAEIDDGDEIDFGESDEEEGEEEATEEVTADEIKNSGGQSEMLEGELEAEEDWDPPLDEDDIEQLDEDFVEDDAGFNGEPAEFAEAEEVEDEQISDDGDMLDIVDVDEIPDDDTDMVFASIGNNLKVIKANRIIASMSRAQAIKAGFADVYLTDQFQDATALEVQRSGLRAGLKDQGFVLAKVNMAQSAVVNRRVEAKVKAQTAAVRRVSNAKDKSFAQCLAIASVGINRKFFKEAENALATSLIANLQQAGVQNAARVVNSSFSMYGTDYAKSLVTLATKLSEMPEQTRNQFASALDLLDDQGEFIEESTVEDVEQFDGPAADFVDAAQDSFEHCEDDDFIPATVTAALSAPARTVRSREARAGRISASAAEILYGGKPLQF